MLLDLKLPRMDGFEVLQWVRGQEGIRSLPVVVLTSSDHIQDVNRAYELGANSFLVKPLEFINYPSLVNTMAKFWLKDASTPIIERTPKPSPNQTEPPS